MASVTGMTVEGIEALMNENVVGLFVDENGRIVYTLRDGSQVDGGLIANLNSPAFSGNPTAPTADAGDNSTRLATTAFVKSVQAAGLVSPSLTGNPTAPTPAVADNDTSIATTKFVKDQLYIPAATAKDLYKREGTEAERNAVFGVPTTDAARIALANKRPVWFNVEKGWSESYYASNAATNPSVAGLLPEVPAGWYPTGPGPSAALAGNVFNTSHQVVYKGLVDFGVTATNSSITSRRRGGTEWFTRSDSEVSVKKDGVYDLSAEVYFPNGGGVYVAALQVRTEANQLIADLQQPVPLLGAYGQVISWKLPRMHVPANGRVYFWIYQGLGTIRVFSLRADYVSPALMYDN